MKSEKYIPHQLEWNPEKENTNPTKLKEKKAQIKYIFFTFS